MNPLAVYGRALWALTADEQLELAAFAVARRDDSDHAFHQQLKAMRGAG